jgi:hypothetical protein
VADLDAFWGRLYRALRAIFGHTVTAAAFIVGWWLIEQLILLLGGGHEMRIFDRIPLSYLFQTGDVALIVVFVVYAVMEVIEIMGKRDG